MPEAIEAYRDHAEHRDQFEILAIHDNSVSSLKELDSKLPKIRETYWKGADLPFPVLLDGNGKTEEMFGVSAHPTSILIDPDGNIVGMVSLENLEEKLPALPAATLWARCVDSHKNIQWDFTEDLLIENWLMFVKLQSGCDVAISSELAESGKFTSETKLPVFVTGYGITIRSLEQLMLAEQGLAILPSADGKSLELARETRSPQPESLLQRVHNRELMERIGLAEPNAKPVDESTPEEQKTEPIPDLELADVTLREAAKSFSRQFDLPVAINAEALKNADAKVSGKIRDDELAKSLDEMLEPIGLQVIVQSEVILIVPIRK